MNLLPISIVAVACTFVYLIVRASIQQSTEQRRIKLVERALDSGVIDEAAKRELLEVVARRGRQRIGAHPVFVLGWVGLFAGIGMILVSLDRSSWWAPAILTTAVSFGVLSVPLAARELQSRKHA